MRIGIELTFVPDLPGDKEFTSLKAAKKAGRAFLKHLTRLSNDVILHDIDLLVKTDPFRRDDDGEFVSWIIEVTNADKPTWAHQWEDPAFVAMIQRVFDEARQLKLYPRIRRRGVHHPSGGLHKHVGIADLFSNNEFFLPKLARFEKNLFCDFANRPYIRWLFAEWFDERENSQVTYNANDLMGNRTWLKENAYSQGRMNHAIVARYSGRLKTAYPTYEFRMFDSVDSAKEIARNVRFLHHWVCSHVNRVNRDEKDVKFTLTLAQFKRLKEEDFAWETVSTFLRELDLDPADFRKPFEENYVLRMRHGEMT